MDLDEAVATIALLQGQVEAQERLLAARDATIAELRLELLRKEFELARFRRALFGVRSERVTPDELVLPGLDLSAPSDGTPPPNWSRHANGRSVSTNAEHRPDAAARDWSWTPRV